MKVKIPVSKVIKALEAKLEKISLDKKNQKVNEERHSKEVKAYNTKVAKLALAQISKAEDLSAHVRWNGEISVDFKLPKGSIELPTEPVKDYETYHEHEYKRMVEDIENALRILRMCEDEYVSASTMKEVSKYL